MLKPSQPSYKIPLIRNLGIQFTKFVAAGGAGTALHYVILIMLVSQFGVPAGSAAFVGATAGACTVYLINSRYTFDNQHSHARTLPRFALMAMVGAVLNGMLVAMLSAAGLHFLLAQIIATVAILVINFTVSKLWIFR
ncbi:GtrA family protein [Massilia norwichensis]|jgi:putative flippase GtrA|uniref:GtrA family protein n=1 Tax=Massilia norwichensis TaxID=1442366 RepID=A0ABT2A9Y4_9BURK|nr:GtrA family protein [Massilia norwichensis]MCS0591014.1 GtrA family protein [Massilia norwichensis]